MGYAKVLQLHLASYKRNRLGIKEKGIFRYRGRDIPTAHVLPVELKWLNILEPIRHEVREYVKQRPEIRLHKYFHHLNSSQAFAFNLFFPFFENGDPSSLLHAMDLRGKIAQWVPEHIPNAKEGTNVDVSWQYTSGAWTYCEVKLSEQEFGKAPDDRRHRDKLANIYAPVLKSHCPVELLQPEQFFENHQVLRNIWLAARDKTASVVFIYPAANILLSKPLKEIVESLHPALRRRIHIVNVETILDKLATGRATPPRLSWYVELLAEKYIPQRDAG